jgi:hypothetical protein
MVGSPLVGGYAAGEHVSQQHLSGHDFVGHRNLLSIAYSTLTAKLYPLKYRAEPGKVMLYAIPSPKLN